MRINNFKLSPSLLRKMAAERLTVLKSSKVKLDLKKDNNSNNQQKKEERTFQAVLYEEMRKKNMSDEDIARLIKKK